MAAAVLSKTGWWVAALAALVLLVALAQHSPDRQQSLVNFQANGLMRHIDTVQVRRLTITPGQAGLHPWRFERGANSAWLLAGHALPADTNAALEAGLRLLHNTPPERTFEAESPEFGLTPPALQIDVEAQDGTLFEASLGAANPMGLAHYVRIRSHGQTTVVLMPSYLMDAWAPALKEAAP